MKLSELIKLAQNALNEYGDLQIATPDFMSEGEVVKSVKSAKVIDVKRGTIYKGEVYSWLIPNHHSPYAKFRNKKPNDKVFKVSEY